MAPKVKITKGEIVEAALGLLKESGGAPINVRTLASVLGCSTQPIFTNFETVEALDQAVLAAAYEKYLDCQKKVVESEQYPKYKAFGMAYIRFAKEEPSLFRLLFMKDNKGEAPAITEDYTTSVELIMKVNGISRERAELMHLEMWACVHGIATMLATSHFLPDWELVSRMVSDVYHGLCSVQVLEGKEG